MQMERSRYLKNWPLIAYAIQDAGAWCCQDSGKPCRNPGKAVGEFEKRLDALWLTDLVSFVSELGEGGLP
jgi:hypothetical protein